ncbi:hypothetical protein OV079_50515 [Nannocystis pusilla]|uniref:Uncharacterized protein n=1 Tax=Nannocystis pusilla TaxID=889268 RepID=A0A9X3J2B5_9BACT|nr:hypothetical protein [Nannocystis pusilla]MCY1013632.1 hypothetical protein [Nannocystis pusilla]
MLTNVDALETPDGTKLYRDDAERSRYYVFPTALGLQRRHDGSAEFTLLFYQDEHPERGARLVAAFTPLFPAVSPEAVPESSAAEPVIVGVSFTGGELRVAWEGFDGEPCVVEDTTHGGFRAEIGLTREQARMIRQTLRAGAETVRVRARLAYAIAQPPLPARVRVDLRAAHRALQDAGGELTGARLGHLLHTMAAPTLRVESTEPSRPSIAFTSEVARIVAPLLAAQLAVDDGRGSPFPLRRLTLLADERVADAEWTVDLSRARTWEDTWEGEWSLSAFYHQTAGTEAGRDCFPEVLDLPPVGTVGVLIENLLPVDGRGIDRVTVKVRSRRLGSLEQNVFEAVFDADAPPVARCAVQRIAMTDFTYQYQVQVRLADADPSRPGVRLFPADPPWVTATEPIVEVGAAALPFVLAHVKASPEVFVHVAHVDIELSPAGDAEPRPLRRAALTPALPYRWLTLPAEDFGSDGLRWRPVLYESASDRFAVGPWQAEGALAAVVTLAHVYPRTPIRIRAQADLAALPEVRAVLVQIKSGRAAADAAPDLTCTLTAGDTRELVVWPDSIFERGFSFRYAIEIADAGWVWTEWRYQTEPETIMPVADDFFRTRVVHLALTAPWSLRNGPDPSSVDAELIFAEVSARSAAQDASFTFTFDRSNPGPRRPGGSGLARARTWRASRSSRSRWMVACSPSVRSSRTKSACLSRSRSHGQATPSPPSSPRA